jgi:hypothetical protein
VREIVPGSANQTAPAVGGSYDVTLTSSTPIVQDRDFGNFRVSQTEMYDRYKGVTELMPFAKAVSAKSHDFDERGEEIHTDYHKMMKIVLDSGYRGFVGIEYEGEKMSEADGIKATKKLLERVHAELSKNVK